MLVCGSDLLQSFSIPGFWIPEQVYAYINLYDIDVTGLRRLNIIIILSLVLTLAQFESENTNFNFFYQIPG